MEWLKKLLGEDNYKKLEQSGMLEVLKSGLGDMEYIPNDPKTVIPKHVFNEKNDKVKLLEGQIVDYEKRLKDISGMVTDETMKTELAKQEAQFKQQLKNQETMFNAQMEKTNKEFLMTNLLITTGVKPNLVPLLLKAVNMEDVIVADNKVVNHEKIVGSLKETYGNDFFKPAQVTGQPLTKGTTQQPANIRDNLVKAYEDAVKRGDPSLFRYQRELEELDKPTT